MPKVFITVHIKYYAQPSQQNKVNLSFLVALAQSSFNFWEMPLQHLVCPKYASDMVSHSLSTRWSFNLLSLFPCLSLTLILSVCLPLSLTHTHSLSPSLSHTHTHTHTLTPYTPTCMRSPTWTPPPPTPHQIDFSYASDLTNQCVAIEHWSDNHGHLTPHIKLTFTWHWLPTSKKLLVIKLLHNLHLVYFRAHAQVSGQYLSNNLTNAWSYDQETGDMYTLPPPPFSLQTLPSNSANTSQWSSAFTLMRVNLNCDILYKFCIHFLQSKITTEVKKTSDTFRRVGFVNLDRVLRMKRVSCMLG